MSLIDYRITLDAFKNGIQKTIQGVVSGDVMARRITATIVSGKAVYDFPLDNSVKAVIYIKKPGMDEPDINDCYIDGNDIVYDLLPSDIALTGTVYCQIKLIKTGRSGAQGVLFSPQFAIEVNESLGNDSAIEASNQFSALENALAKAEQVYDQRVTSILLENMIFRVTYADGTVYEHDFSDEAFPGIKEAEAERVKAELERQAAEGERQAAEDARKAAEAERERTSSETLANVVSNAATATANMENAVQAAVNSAEQKVDAAVAAAENTIQLSLADSTEKTNAAVLYAKTQTDSVVEYATNETNAAVSRAENSLAVAMQNVQGDVNAFIEFSNNEVNAAVNYTHAETDAAVERAGTAAGEANAIVADIRKLLDEGGVVTPGEKENWNEAASLRHVHSNKELLDALSQEMFDTIENGIANANNAIEALNSQKVDKVIGKGLSTNDYTMEEKEKLSGIEDNAQKNSITGVKGNAEAVYRTGEVNITPANIGLGNVANERQYSASNPQPSVEGSSGSCTGNAATATKWNTARNINGMLVDGSANRANYGTCSTAAATAAKVVACTGFALVTGAEITVKFTVTNTAANPTLNVNSTGAKAIYYRGAAISAGYLAANRTYTFRYNGTQYDLVGDIDTNTTYGAASASANGLMTTGVQTFAGAKTFNGTVACAGASAVGAAQARNIYAGTDDMTAGTTALTTGMIYLQYE